MLRSPLKAFLLASLLGLLSACGGGNHSASLQSIDVTPGAASAAAGSATQLTATGMFSDGSHADLTNQVTWTTSNAAVATVSTAGLVTGVAVGGATVAAALRGVSGSTTYTVTAAVLASIEVTPPRVSIAAGRTVLMTATGVYSDNSTQNLTQVTWTSSNSAVASVSAGVVTAVAAGTATITAASGTISGSTTLTVTGAVLTTIQVTPATPSIAKGLTQQFSATGIFSDNSKQDLTSQVAWSSSNTAVTTISASGGLATAAAVGGATISAAIGTVSGSTTFTVTAALLTAIQVTPANPSLAKGLTRQLSATGIYTDNSTADLTTQATWNSSNTAAATVSNAAGSAGAVTAVAPGAATIAANMGSISGSTSVTVTPATLVSIQVGPPAPSIPLGVPQQFTATGIYTDLTTQNLTTMVTWSSSAAAVATISNAAGSQGLATPASVGSATIQATLGTTSGSTLLSVTPAALVSIQVNPATPMVAKGLTKQFTATGLYTDNSTQDLTAQVTWASSNTAVATISNAAGSYGLASTPGMGTATISASLNVVGSTTLTVTPAALVSIAVTPANPSIAKGLTQQFIATGTYTDQSTQILTASPSILWSSDTTTVATISNAAGSQGLASTPGTGTATISAIFGMSGISGSTLLTVTPAVINSIVIAPTTPSLASGATLQFTATGMYTDSTPPQDLTAAATWTSSDTTIATINPNTGLATASSAVSSGQTNIQAAYNPGAGVLTASTTLTVTMAALDSITLAPVDPSVAAGLTVQFTATGHYSNGTHTVFPPSAVTWASSDNTLAVVGLATGLAKGLQVGTPMITAAQGSVSGSTTLNVTPAQLTSIAVAQSSGSPTAPNIALGLNAQYVATGTYTDGSTGPLTGPVTWASTDTGVATVDGSGVATPVAYGTTSIQITDNNSGVMGSANNVKVISSFQYGTNVYDILSTGPRNCTTSACHSATGNLGPPSTVVLSSDYWTLFDSATSATPASDTRASIAAGEFQVNSTSSPTQPLVNPGDAAGSTFYIALCGSIPSGSFIEMMPQGKSALTSAQCTIIGQWINDGALP